MLNCSLIPIFRLPKTQYNPPLSRVSSNGKTVASQATDVGSIPITRFYLFTQNQQSSLKTRNGFQAAFVLGGDVWHGITMRLNQRQPEKPKYLFQAAFGYWMIRQMVTHAQTMQRHCCASHPANRNAFNFTGNFTTSNPTSRANTFSGCLSCKQIRQPEK